MTRYKKGGFFNTIIELSKVKITIAVAVTTITGYVLAKGKFDSRMILPTIGIFLLACGASVINHIMENRSDSQMQRTRNRPLPSGAISVSGAVALSVFQIVSGAIILYFSTNITGLILGLVALIWYDFIYTPLKKITANAVIPGSVIGAIPPLVGWVAAGQSLMNIQAIVMAFFFFVWQVPHFYLLVLIYGKEYEAAGLPSLTQLYSPKQIKWLIFTWILVTALVALLLPLFSLTHSWITLTGLIIASVWLVVVFSKTVFKSSVSFSPGKYFMKINYFVLTVVLFLVMDHIFARYLL